jgi:membrane protein DedA with SNARE-associated domain
VNFFEGAVHDYGYGAVAVALLLEHCGVPVPAGLMFVGAAALAGQGALDIVTLMLVAWAAATIGNIGGYAIGRYGGHRLIVQYGARIGITAARLAMVTAFFDRYGASMLIGARFFAPLRETSGIVAGTLAMAWQRFLLFNALSAALWIGWWGTLSYWAGQGALDIVAGIDRTAAIFYTLGAAILAIAIVLLYRRRRENKARR